MAKDGTHSADEVIIAEVVRRRYPRGERDENSGRDGGAKDPYGMLVGGSKHTERCAEEVGLHFLRSLSASSTKVDLELVLITEAMMSGVIPLWSVRSSESPR